MYYGRSYKVIRLSVESFDQNIGTILMFVEIRPQISDYYFSNDLIRGYISHQHQKVVFSRREPFPKVSTSKLIPQN